jgi:hypothetical protein
VDGSVGVAAPEVEATALTADETVAVDEAVAVTEDDGISAVHARLTGPAEATARAETITRKLCGNMSAIE